MHLRWRPALLLFGIALLLAWQGWRHWAPQAPWTNTELALLESLSLEALPPLAAKPSNAVADDPRAVALGRTLFFDTRLSANGEIACASCHQPEHRFTDGLPQAQALGHSQRNTPSLIGVAYSPWLYWDGRKDSLWSQALEPLEDPAEHGSNRLYLARLVTTAPEYRAAYTALFGLPPDFSDTKRFPANAGPVQHPAWHAAWQAMHPADRNSVSQVFSNLGKAIAAWERQLLPQPTRFDHYVAGLLSNDATASTLLDRDEKAGLRLFIGKGRCLECHNGPLFTNNEFHNTGLLPYPGSLPDQGRGRIIDHILADPFNCKGRFSDAAPGTCLELRYMRRGVELIGAMRTPSLRNLAGTAPYMHRGQMATLAEVLAHYNNAPLALIGHNEATPLGLSGRQLRQLERFFGTLAGKVEPLRLPRTQPSIRLGRQAQ